MEHLQPTSTPKKSSMEQMMDYAAEFRTLLNQSFQKNYQSMRQQTTTAMTMREYALQMQHTMMEMREQFNQGYETLVKTARSASSRSSSFDLTLEQKQNSLGVMELLSEDLLYQVMTFLPPPCLAVMSSQVNGKLAVRCSQGAAIIWREHVYAKWQLPDPADCDALFIDLSTMTSDDLRKLYPLCATMVHCLVDDGNPDMQHLSSRIAQFIGAPGESNRSLQSLQTFPTLVIKQDISMVMVNACANMMLKMMLAMRQSKLSNSEDSTALAFPSPTTLMREMLYTVVPHHSVPFAVADKQSGKLSYNISPRCIAYYEVHISRAHRQDQRQDNISSARGTGLTSYPATLHHTTTTTNNNSNNDEDEGEGEEGEDTDNDDDSHHTHTANANASNTGSRRLLLQQAQVYDFDCVAVGLASTRFQRRSRLPGWDEESYGYHGDDGAIFHGRGSSLQTYGPTFGVNDTVGCGYNYSDNSIFFTLNGVYLGTAFVDVGAEYLHQQLERSFQSQTSSLLSSSPETASSLAQQHLHTPNNTSNTSSSSSSSTTGANNSSASTTINSSSNINSSSKSQRRSFSRYKELDEWHLVPTVGIDANCRVDFNFGAKPFVFNLQDFLASHDFFKHI